MYENIKKIIFDLDDTLIMWHDDYFDAVKQALREYNLTCSYRDVNAILTKSEVLYHHYDINLIIELIEKELGVRVTPEFINTWFEYLSMMAYRNPEANETLEYLSKKYELAVLTNFFRYVQKKRLEKVGMLHYFQEVIGGERYVKPDVRAYELAIGSYKKDDCLMVGDSYELDYLGAKNAGLEAIYLAPNEPPQKLIRIKSIIELKDIL